MYYKIPDSDKINNLIEFCTIARSTGVPSNITKAIALISLLVTLTACQTDVANRSATENSQPQIVTNREKPGQGKTIRVGSSTLLEEHFQTEIINIGLEKLGYKIIPMSDMTYVTIYIALSNGDLDYTASYWERSHFPLFEEAGGDRTMQRVGVLTSNLSNGYQIDKKTADAYNITNLAQLKDPKLAELFDTDNDGKANLVGCNPGWLCYKVINHHLKVYGLEDTVEHDRGHYNLSIDRAIDRYQAGKPILYYTWTPLWVGNILKLDEDVVWLGVPYTSFPQGYKNPTARDTSIGDLNLGFLVDRMRIVANKDFLNSHPAAAKFFELVEIPAEDISAQNQKIKQGEDSREQIRAHAREWISANQEQFESWLEQARDRDNLN
ncbi:glycine betaine/L-proline ABC transporter substrate-binding protein ProX [Roseofilum casamattae]|uniref:Glycine betaine/L-proline ABC transporter substrate-binding protein ProX n=1 Tax=Roseofilum casamattae BLCC-M143 TaxID=3022442 RepID=A0ABT7BW74_9CYAN|nr:glycine betaine/L-proline ABC transporter substrate-binding protein ProX [Roseofilum casamattae]MDJ1183448.1 glycine betaine/L-proline ABC transporter substrate-binding protein ProX [Roseofilum casamattae BLCC-M143]